MKNRWEIIGNHYFVLKCHVRLGKKPPAGMHHTEVRIGMHQTPSFPISTHKKITKIQSSGFGGRRQRRQPVNMPPTYAHILYTCAYLVYMRTRQPQNAYSRIDAFDKPLGPPTDAPTTLDAVFLEIKIKSLVYMFVLSLS